MIGSALTVRECVLISRMIDALRVKHPGMMVAYEVSHQLPQGFLHTLTVRHPETMYLRFVETEDTVEGLYAELGRPGDLTKEYEAYYAGKPFPVAEGHQ
jgi:hypothetical protein